MAARVLAEDSMAPTLRSIKSQVSSIFSGSRQATEAIAAKKGLLSLGPRPALTRNKKLEATWEALLTDPPVNYGDPNNWREGADVRPSSFPFCPRRYVLDRLGLKLPDTFVVESNFYTQIGLAVHYVSQNAFARTGRLWGLWSCARPTCKKRLTKTPSTYPDGKICPFCAADKFEYDELTLDDTGAGLRGHADGVLLFKDRSAVLEVKTAEDEKVKKLQGLNDADLTLLFQTEAPWYGYWHQASTYASLIRLKYPQLPPLKTVEFVIFSRNTPKNAVAFSLPVPEDNTWWWEIRARIRMAQRAKELQVIPVGFAENESDISNLPTCRWCSHRDECLRPVGKVRYAADALYDRRARENLLKVLEQERTMGSVITGDVREPSDVLVPTPAPKPEKTDDDKTDDDKGTAKKP